MWGKTAIVLFPATLHFTATARGATTSRQRNACFWWFSSTWLAALITVWCDKERRSAAPVPTGLESAIFSYADIRCRQTGETAAKALENPVTVIEFRKPRALPLLCSPPPIRLLSALPLAGESMFGFDEKYPNKFVRVSLSLFFCFVVSPWLPREEINYDAQIELQVLWSSVRKLCKNLLLGQLSILTHVRLMDTGFELIVY